MFNLIELSNWEGYIGALELNAEPATKAEWRAIIWEDAESEAKNWGKSIDDVIDDETVENIIRVLDEDGYVED